MSTVKKIWSVVIVDDSRTMQAMLDNAFSRRDDFKVVGFASDASAGVEMVMALAPDIVTIDLFMPYLDGAAMLGLLADQHHVCKIVVSDLSQKNLILADQLKVAGASACLGKTELLDDPDKFFGRIAAAANTVLSAKRRVTPSAELPVEDGLAAVAAHPAPLIFPVPADEAYRLAFLRRKQLSNAVHERQFDLVTKHVATMTSFPACLLTFIDRRTQWIKSAYGLAVDSTPRDQAFCNYTIAQGGIFIVTNTAADQRFARNPLVIGAPHIKSYVGHAVMNRDGVRVGALCVIDTRVRVMTSQILAQLAGMSEIVAEMIDQRPSMTA